MIRVGVDTNVVLSFLTDRDPAQRQRATELFVAAAGGDPLIVLHQQVVSEAVYVLLNGMSVAPNVVGATMRDLLELPGVTSVDTLPWPRVWNQWPGRVRDFGDACLLASARAGAFDRLATFDRELARRARRHGVPTWW